MYLINEEMLGPCVAEKDVKAMVNCLKDRGYIVEMGTPTDNDITDIPDNVWQKCFEQICLKSE